MSVVIAIAPFLEVKRRRESIERYSEAFLRLEGACLICLARWGSAGSSKNLPTKARFQTFFEQSVLLSENLKGVRSEQSLRRRLPGVRLQASRLMFKISQAESLPPVLGFSKDYLSTEIRESLRKMRNKILDILPPASWWYPPYGRFVPHVLVYSYPEPA